MVKKGGSISCHTTVQDKENKAQIEVNIQDDDTKLRPPFSPNKKKAYILTVFYTKNVENDETFFTFL